MCAHVVKWKYFHKNNMFCHGVSTVNWAAGFSAFINSKYVYCHNRIHWSSLISRQHSVHNQSKTVNEFNVVMSIKQYWKCLHHNSITISFVTVLPSMDNWTQTQVQPTCLLYTCAGHQIDYYKYKYVIGHRWVERPNGNASLTIMYEK